MSDLEYLSKLSPAEQRAAIALAEAIIPGSPTIKAADERLVAFVARVAHDVAPPLVPMTAKLVRALDLAAVRYTGRRFADLGADAQERLLQRWYEDPIMRSPVQIVSFAYKFCHFDSGRGYKDPRKLDVATTLEQPAYLRQIVPGDDFPDDEVECDVAVVGTGAGGAIVGKELADRGLAVVFLEEGKHWRRDAMKGSAVEAHYKFYRGAFVLGQSMFPVFMGRMVGGSTAINTGTCFRTPEWILDEWCDTLRTDALSPENMQPYFERVERTLGADYAPRKYIGPAGDAVERGCARFGWKNGPVLRNATGCEGVGFCDFGCPTDARRSTNLSYLPPALKKGAVCLSELRCDEVVMDGARAVGVVGVTKSGRRIRVRARAVVLAMGAIPTPQFLLERGLCNSSGQVGRNLSVHPSAGFSALMNEEIRGRFYMPQGWHVSEFMKEGILITSAQADENFSGVMLPYWGKRLMRVLEGFDRMVSFGVIIRDRHRQGRLFAKKYDHTLIKYMLKPEDVELAHRGLVVAGELCRAAGAKACYPAIMGVPPCDTDADWERFKRMQVAPNQTMFVAYHPLGTCQMGRDPKTSVVGLEHETHDVRGLYIVDGSTVPGPPGVNPQVTIMAMATRAAVHIADTLGARAPAVEPQPVDAMAT